MTLILVTRHRGAQEWAERQGLSVRVLAHLEPDTLGPGDCVAGNLPLHLVAELCGRGVRFLHLEIRLPEAWRGRSLSAAELEGLGARLVAYDVRRLPEPPG